MTAPQTPTPGIPLSAESVKLLKAGDVLIPRSERWPYQDVSPLTFDRLDSQGLIIVSQRPDESFFEDRFTFIGRPDAEGWVTWSGGEKPLHKDQWVRVRFRDGEEDESAVWNFDWLHAVSPADDDIIAFRLTTPSDQGDEVHSDDGALEHLSVEAPVSESIGIHAMTGPVATEYLRARGMKGVTVQGTVVVLNADGAGHSFADAPMTPTTPASGSDGLIERLRAQKVIPSGPVDGNLWMPRNPDGLEAADALEAAEKRIGELDDQLAQAAMLAVSETSKRLAAESQVAALKAALEKAREDISAWAEECGGTGWQDVLVEDLKSIDQALKEGR